MGCPTLCWAWPGLPQGFLSVSPPPSACESPACPMQRLPPGSWSSLSRIPYSLVLGLCWGAVGVLGFAGPASVWGRTCAPGSWNGSFSISFLLPAWYPTLNLGGLGTWVVCFSHALAGPWYVSVQDPGPRIPLPPSLWQTIFALPLPQKQWPLGGFPALPHQLKAFVFCQPRTQGVGRLLCLCTTEESSLSSPDLLLIFLLSTSSTPTCEWVQSPCVWAPSETSPHSACKSFEAILVVSSLLPLLQSPFLPWLPKANSSRVVSFLVGACHSLEAVHVTALGPQLCGGLTDVYDSVDFMDSMDYL